ncbi:hypothetical protein PZ61_0205365 [Streptomyces sp. MNU77]|nr:hypothetical protein PZ61_0205365 [Streptomyces sp. MNU77]
MRERAYKVMAENGLRRVRLHDARASCFTYLANKGGAGPPFCPLGRSHRRPREQALVREAECGGSTVGGGYVGRTGERPGPAHEANVRCGSVGG